MIETLKPGNPAEVLEVLAWAAAEQEPIDIAGAGSKDALGRPPSAARRLDLSHLDDVALYEPEELVMTAGAGTPLGEIDARLAAAHQMLAFEPPDYGPLLGAAAAGATIGGVLACNFSGPRRVTAGAARDHFLGAKGVSGRGEAFVCGGRVVKNVTGYDMCKLLAGSWGTLAAMTEVTIKTVPVPEDTRTVLILGLDDAAAVGALGRAARGRCGASGLAHLPAWAAASSGLPEVAGAGAAVTALRLEGARPLGRGARDGPGRRARRPRPERSLGRRSLQASVARGARRGPAGRRRAPGHRVAAFAHPVRRRERGWAHPPDGGVRGALRLGRRAGVAQARARRAGARRGGARGGGRGRRTRVPVPRAARGARGSARLRAPAARARGPRKRVKDGFDPRGILNRGRMLAVP